MLERENNDQLELFSGTDKAVTKGKSGILSFFTTIRDHEKVVLLIMTMVIVSIVSFSLGVEKGKMIAKPIAKESAAPIRQQAITKEEAVNQEAPTAPEQGYIIQLASYKSQDSAQKEALSLKKKGFSPLVLTKGSYTVLCLGSFPSKEKAQSLLSELKKRYKDCYVRRL